MKIAAVLALACMVGISLPAVADDDPPLGSRLGKRKDIAIPQSQQEAARAGHRFAGCIYVKQGSAVRAMLNEVDAGTANSRLGTLDSKGSCSNLMILAPESNRQMISLPNDIYRGLLAEAALSNDYVGIAPEPLAKQPGYDRPWFAATGRARAVDEMGACVADVDPAGVRALLATTAETSEEKNAISALAPTLGACLTAGATLNANRQSLRAALAEALYHRVIASPAVPPVLK